MAIWNGSNPTRSLGNLLTNVTLQGSRILLVDAKLQREQCTAPSRLSSPVTGGSFLRIPGWEDWGTLEKIRGNHHKPRISESLKTFIVLIHTYTVTWVLVEKKWYL